MKASVIICTKGRSDFVEKCLDSLKKQTYKNFEILVVDTGSKETKRVCKKYGVIYIEERRSGRCLARNVGIENAKGEIIFFFDDDTYLERDYIEKILENYKNESVAGAGGVEIEDENIQQRKKDRRSLEKKFLEIFIYKLNPFMRNREIGIVKSSGRVTDNFGRDKIAIIKPIDVMHLKGFAMSFRKRLLERVGMFDVWYDKTAHREETDVCIRIIKTGHRLVFDPRTGVYHYLADSERPAHFQTMYNMYKQHQYFIFKNDLVHGLGWVEYFLGELIESLMVFVNVVLFRDLRFFTLFRAKCDGIKAGLRAKWKLS